MSHDPFRKYLYWSLWAHLAVFLLFILASYLPGTRTRLHQDKIVWVTLPKGTTDTIGSPLKKSEGLPKTTIQEQKKALESPPRGEKKPSMTYKAPEFRKQKKNEPPVPKKPGHPDSRIENALARMQKEAAKKKAEPEAAQVPDAPPGGFTYGTNTGKYVSPDDPEYVMYQAKIRKRIMDEWIIPLKFTGQEMGQGMGLISKIVVHMNDQGEVVATEWEQKSGNPAFDLSAIRAIEKASPLDIPPERLKYEVFNEGFIIEFKPQPQQ